MNIVEVEPSVELLDITQDAEKHIAKAMNLSRTHNYPHDMSLEKARDLIRSALDKDHLSVIEHASASFLIQGCSRSFTHQLVRHRLAAYMQQSQRFIDEQNFVYIVPPTIRAVPEAKQIYDQFMEQARQTYINLLKYEKSSPSIPREDARFVLPNAAESKIVITANFREFRHIFEMRGSPEAQWEIRKVAVKMFNILSGETPAVFADFRLGTLEDGSTIILRCKEWLNENAR